MMVNSDNTQKAPPFCNSFKIVEYILCIASAWAAVTLILTPTLLKQKPPPFYHALQGAHLDWQTGALLLVVVFLHFLALRIAPCRPDAEPCPKCLRLRRAAAHVRSMALLAEVALWFFLTACYGVLAIQGEITLASGLCVIFASCASLASYCISRERARHQVHAEEQSKKNERVLDGALS